MKNCLAFLLLVLMPACSGSANVGTASLPEVSRVDVPDSGCRVHLFGPDAEGNYLCSLLSIHEGYAVASGQQKVRAVTDGTVAEAKLTKISNHVYEIRWSAEDDAGFVTVDTQQRRMIGHGSKSIREDGARQ